MGLTVGCKYNAKSTAIKVLLHNECMWYMRERNFYIFYPEDILFMLVNNEGSKLVVNE